MSGEEWEAERTRTGRRIREAVSVLSVRDLVDVDAMRRVRNASALEIIISKCGW